MQGIIIAAGMGNRMESLTKNQPKCLLKISNKSLLELSVEGLKYAGCKEIYIITGYKAEKIKNLGYKTIHNREYKTNNILHSFSNALSVLNEDTLVSYSDIYVEKKIFMELAKKRDDIVLTIDKDWKEYYKNRKSHPQEQAEKVLLDNLNTIDKIGKHLVINNERKSYEFIGLFKLSKKGCKVIKDTFIQLNNNYQPNQKFENSKKWREAYLTDFFQYIIRNKISKINSHVISKCWAEFDTIEDYGRLEYIKKIQKLSI